MENYSKCPTCGKDNGRDVYKCRKCGHIGCNHDHCYAKGSGRCQGCDSTGTTKQIIGHIK